jgi:hypothetical protein
VTIKSAASAIIDDLVDSGSFLRTQVSACDYGVMDTAAAGCAIVLQPSQSAFDLIAYGGVTYDTWGITAECYVRETGNVEQTLTRVWDIIDAVKTAINSGTCGNTATRVVQVNSINRPRAVYESLGGNDFLPVFVNIAAKEDP